MLSPGALFIASDETDSLQRVALITSVWPHHYNEERSSLPTE